MTITEILKKNFPQAITDSHQQFGDETVFVDRQSLVCVLQFLRDDPDCSFNLFLDLCGVDYMGQEPRFEVVYHLYSLSKKARLRVRVKLPESDLKITSVTSLWEAANWFEREAYDMYGIHFEGHPNLKRILMWNEFEGYPLRKDYPIQRRQPIPVPTDIV